VRRMKMSRSSVTLISEWRPELRDPLYDGWPFLAMMDPFCAILGGLTDSLKLW